MKWFKRNKTFKAFRNRAEYPIEPVFKVGGVTYYAFTDVNNMPAGRTLAALPIFVELKTNADENYLKTFVSAFESIINDPAKISIEGLIKLKNQIKDRMNWAFTPDIVYKYAAVRYFDENENPDTYDSLYADKKIAFWKKHIGVNDFFLAEPIQRLIPALNAVQKSLPMYLSTILKVQQHQLEELSDAISWSRISPEEKLSLHSAITALKKQYDLENYPQTSTSSMSIIEPKS